MGKYSNILKPKLYLRPFLECNEVISVLPYTEISASSHKNSRKRKSCMPDMGDLDSAKGWCPRKQNGKIMHRDYMTE